MDMNERPLSGPESDQKGHSGRVDGRRALGALYIREVCLDGPITKFTGDYAVHTKNYV